MANVVELQTQVYSDIEALCATLSDDEWAMATDCPGWSVQDNISHLVGTEASLLGRPAPEHDPGSKPWIRNPIGAGNEVQVDYRRARTPQEIIDEFRDVTAERTKALTAMSDEDLSVESWTPIGQGTVRDLLGIRVMDFWVHEQDIRRAVGKPGGLDGPVAHHAFSRHAQALPFVVGKKVAPPDGTTVVFDVRDFGVVGVGVEGKRAKQLDAIPEAPTVRLTTDIETFNCLCCGRGDASEHASRVKVEGDTSLGRAVLAQMNFMV